MTITFSELEMHFDLHFIDKYSIKVNMSENASRWTDLLD